MSHMHGMEMVTKFYVAWGKEMVVFVILKTIVNSFIFILNQL